MPVGETGNSGTSSPTAPCQLKQNAQRSTTLKILVRSDAAHPSFRRARESQFPEFPRPVANLLLSSLVVRPCFRGIGFLLLASFELPLGADAIFFWM
jgi:hypothetical protein